MHLSKLSTMLRGSQRMNPLLMTDVYKMGHMEQYPPGTQYVYSYMQPRSNKTYQETVFFGTQYLLKNYLSEPVTHEDVDSFLEARNHIVGTDVLPDTEKKLRELAELGHWPLRIKAVPEGTVLPVKNAVMTITNTDPRFYWAVGYVESVLLKLWYPNVVATTSYQFRKIVERYFRETVDPDMYFLKPFQVHDFGYRGDPSEEGSRISGLSHLLSFTGSDTVVAYPQAVSFYNADPEKETIMASVPASEHSVMCAYGRDQEIDAYRHLLKTYPTGIVSIVSDTYNVWEVLTNMAEELKDEIEARDGKVVFRPDSGNPEYIICGNPDADPNSPEGKGCIRLLDEVFGSSVNGKGYKVLNPKVGLIYGDGMYLERYDRIMAKIKEMGYAASNLVIGVGSLLRYHNRDTLGYAVKASRVVVDGEARAIMKDPITDPGKTSHRGFIKLLKTDDGYTTIDDVTPEEEAEGVLQKVFENGKLYNETSLREIRQRVTDSLN